jgi:hypothetical protein
METWTLKRLPSWMHVADPRLLLAMDGRDQPTSLGALRRSQPYPLVYLRQRCERLAAEGLVQPVFDDRYRLRDLGQEFLNGEVAVEDLEAGWTWVR